MVVPLVGSCSLGCGWRHGGGCDCTRRTREDGPWIRPDRDEISVAEPRGRVSPWSLPTREDERDVSRGRVRASVGHEGLRSRRPERGGDADAPLPEVEELVEAARAGDAAAWDALVDRYLPAGDRGDPPAASLAGRRRRRQPDRVAAPGRAPRPAARAPGPARLAGHDRPPRGAAADPAPRSRPAGRPRAATTFDTAEVSDPGEALVEDLKSHALREAMLELPEKPARAAPPAPRRPTPVL